MPSIPALAFRATLDTIRSRFKSGPFFPGWSFSYEVTARMLKLRAAATAGMPLAEQRDFNEKGGDQEAKRMRSKVVRTDARVGGIPGEWFVPKGSSPGRVVLYIHGGGFVAGSSRTHAEMLMRLSIAADARIFAPNYRLAPEHPYPAQIEDCKAVCRGLLADGVRPDDLVLAGDSAGGNLAIVLPTVFRDEGIPLPAASAALSPWVDVTNREGSLRDHERFDWATPSDFDMWQASYVGAEDPRNPRISPIYADLRDSPPLHIQVGTAEMLLDQVRAMAARAREAGISLDYREIPGMVHNCVLLAGYFPECQAVIDDLGAWMKKHAAI